MKVRGPSPSGSAIRASAISTRSRLLVCPALNAAARSRTVGFDDRAAAGMASSALVVRANRRHKPTIGQTGGPAPPPPVRRTSHGPAQARIAPTGTRSGQPPYAPPADPAPRPDLRLFPIAPVAPR